MGRGEELTVPAPDVVLCADWSKHARGRAVWMADVRGRVVRPLRPPAAGWTFGSVLDAAEHEGRGAALVAFDAPLGVPSSLLAASGAGSFVDWLQRAARRPGAFEPVLAPADWSVARPFFRVAAGKGGRSAFEERARELGVELRRRVDVATGANPAFAFDLPGQVAPAAQALWRELAAERSLGRAFSLWPFEDPRDGAPIVAEIYPRAAYAVALADALPVRPIALAKRNAAVRADVVDRLAAADWVARATVRLEALEEARGNEDDFDAFVTAAALLRLLLEERPLAADVDPVAEGAILCTGSSSPDAPNRVAPSPRGPSAGSRPTNDDRIALERLRESLAAAGLEIVAPLNGRPPGFRVRDRRSEVWDARIVPVAPGRGARVPD